MQDKSTEQQQKSGRCPSTLQISLPIFSGDSVLYVPYNPESDADILEPHYKSNNVLLPLTFNKSTIKSLDETYEKLVGQLAANLKEIRVRIDKIHAISDTTTQVPHIRYVGFFNTKRHSTDVHHPVPNKTTNTMVTVQYYQSQTDRV